MTRMFTAWVVVVLLLAATGILVALSPQTSPQLPGTRVLLVGHFDSRPFRLTRATDDAIVVGMGTRSAAKRRVSARDSGTAHDGDAWELSKSQVCELQRRVRDLNDRIRYVLVSVFTPRIVLYYNVANDTFGMNDPSLGTLFKRRVAAVAIQRLLRARTQVIRCRADRHDRIVKSSLPRLRPIIRLSPVGRRGDLSRSRHA